MEDEALGFPMLLVKPSPGLAAFPPWSNKLHQNQPERPMSLAFLLPSWPLPGVPEAILNTRHLPSHFCHCIVPGDGIGSFLAHHCHFHTILKSTQEQSNPTGNTAGDISCSPLLDASVEIFLNFSP